MYISLGINKWGDKVLIRPYRAIT